MRTRYQTSSAREIYWATILAEELKAYPRISSILGPSSKVIQCNALGKKSDLLTPHLMYERLGLSSQERQQSYRDLFKVHVYERLVTELRRATNSGLALGGEKIVSQIEALSGQRVSARRAGRPSAKR